MLAARAPHLPLEPVVQATTLLAAGQHRAALAVVNRALRTSDGAALRLARARALLAFRAEDEARRDLGRCLRFEPEHGPAYEVLCELALRRGDLTGAEVFLGELTRLAPAAPRTLELAEVVLGWKRARQAARRARPAARVAA